MAGRSNRPAHRATNLLNHAANCEHGKTKLSAGLDKMSVEGEHAPALERAHNDQTAAIDHAPGFVTVAPKNFQSISFQPLIDSNRFHDRSRSDTCPQ